MRLGQDVLTDSRIALSREWLLGNGLGGSASGTVAGAHTRPSHAYLTAVDAESRVTTLLLKLEERLLGADGTSELGSNLQPQGGLRPNGHLLLEEFRLDPWPKWRYRAQGVSLEKSMFLIYGHHAVAITYRHRGGLPARLSVSPLVTARDPGTVDPEPAELAGQKEGIPGRVRIETLPGRPTLTLWHNAAFMPVRARQRLCYPHSEEGGEPIVEDALVPGYFEAELKPGGSLHVIASAEDDLFRALAREDRLGSTPPRTLTDCVTLLEDEERDRDATWRRAAFVSAAVTLKQATDAHRGSEPGGVLGEPHLDERDVVVGGAAANLRLGLMRRGWRLSLAGPHAASHERGNDTLRALAGLVTLRGFATTHEILETYVDYLDEGLAPESFDPLTDTPRYGDPAPSLWLMIVSELYARRSQDLDFARDRLYPALEAVVHAYRSGTRHGVRVDGDGLLAAGERGVKRADVNALWYHALLAIGQLARATGRKESGAFHLAWAHEHQKRFNELMWDEARGCLYTALGPGGEESGPEPSQLLAVSLPPSMLAPESATRLLETVTRELFTPFGLRETPGASRVSPAWLGAFYTAYVRAHDRSPESQARVRTWIEPLRSRLEQDLCGGLPEAFEIGPGAGDLEPAGSPISIVAASELMRAWIEELDHAEAAAAV